MNHKQGFTTLLIGFIVILAVIGGGIYTWQKNKLTVVEDNPSIMSDEVTTMPDQPTDDATTDWKTYRNDEFGFEFKYPGEWKLETIYEEQEIKNVNEYISHPYSFDNPDRSQWLVHVQEQPPAMGNYQAYIYLIVKDNKIYKGTIDEAMLAAGQKYLESKDAPDKFGKPEIVTINGVKAVKVFEQGYEERFGHFSYTFPVQGLGLDLFTGASGESKFPKETGEILISTLQFN